MVLMIGKELLPFSSLTPDLEEIFFDDPEERLERVFE